MSNFIFDTSAILRFLDHSAGAVRVQALIEEHVAGESSIRISAVQWGELAGILMKRHGRDQADSVLHSVRRLLFEVVPADADRAERAASLRIERGLPYADAFAADLTRETPDSILVTADFDFKAVKDLVLIEFLPPDPAI